MDPLAAGFSFVVVFGVSGVAPLGFAATVR